MKNSDKICELNLENEKLRAFVCRICPAWLPPTIRKQRHELLRSTTMKNSKQKPESACFYPSPELLDLVEFCNNLLKPHSKLPSVVKDKLQLLLREVEDHLLTY